jgi:hypothetical protein
VPTIGPHFLIETNYMFLALGKIANKRDPCLHIHHILEHIVEEELGTRVV